MGDPLARLVVDNIDYGAQLPRAANDSLDDIAEATGVKNGTVVLLLASQAFALAAGPK